MSQYSSWTSTSFYTFADCEELGINPSHILQKSLTVLNPLSRIDERIMDDADLAGPFVFCFAFAFVLLLVSCHLDPDPTALHRTDEAVRQTTILIHLRCGPSGRDCNLPPSQHDVTIWYRRLPDCFCSGLLSSPNGRSGQCRYRRWNRPRRGLCPGCTIDRLVHTLGVRYIHRGIEDG